MQNTNLNQDFITNFISMLQNTNIQKEYHTIDDCIKLWLDYSSTKCRPDTITYYKKCINYILPYLKSNKCYYIENITLLKLNSIIAEIKNLNKYKNNTINKFIGAIKPLIQFCYMNDIIENNPIAKFQKLKKDDIETITINNELISKIFNYLNTLNLSNISNLRNILFTYLLRDTGVRLNELRHIEINNINFNNNSILLTFTKTHENRYVYISDLTKELLIKYIDIIKPNKYLICNEITKDIMADDFIYKFFNKIKKACNINQSISPHKWRHTLATCLLKENVNLENIRKLLGHSSLEITKKYLHVDNEYQQNTILKALKEIQNKQKKDIE